MSVNLLLFDQGPFPSDWPVVPSGKEGDGWEYDEVVKFFKGRRLADVTYETLKSEYTKDWTAAHHLLSEQALAFFLPALLRLSQENYNDTFHNAGLLADQLAFFFLRMARREMDYHLLPLLNTYSKLQLGVIATFLHELSTQHYKGMGDLDDAACALKLFWAEYLPERC